MTSKKKNRRGHHFVSRTKFKIQLYPKDTLKKNKREIEAV
jgi:hypothetical protein